MSNRKNISIFQHLATGLSGLFSELPRSLDGPYFGDPSWYRLSNVDLGHLPEVQHFLSTLEFCDAVIQVANPLVREHLLGLIYMGFLVPVLKPALVQVRNLTFLSKVSVTTFDILSTNSIIDLPCYMIKIINLLLLSII